MEFKKYTGINEEGTGCESYPKFICVAANKSNCKFGNKLSHNKCEYSCDEECDCRFAQLFEKKKLIERLQKEIEEDERLWQHVQEEAKHSAESKELEKKAHDALVEKWAFENKMNDFLSELGNEMEHMEFLKKTDPEAYKKWWETITSLIKKGE